MNSIDTIQSNLAAVKARADHLATKLADAQGRRAKHAHGAVMADAKALTAYAAAVTDESVSAALIADAGRLEQALTADLAAAKSAATAEASRVAEAAFDVAFRKRLHVVSRAFNLSVPTETDGAVRAYRWLATVWRTPDVVKNRDIGHWLDEMQMAGFGSVRADELMIAARMHGDIAMADGGHAWDRQLGISIYSGRAAASVSLDAPLQEHALVQAEAFKAEPVVLLLGQVNGHVSQHAIA